jgi:hypothetical protein
LRHVLVARLCLPLPPLCRPWLFVVIFILVALFVCVTTAAASPVVVDIAAMLYPTVLTPPVFWFL